MNVSQVNRRSDFKASPGAGVGTRGQSSLEGSREGCLNLDELSELAKDDDHMDNFEATKKVGDEVAAAIKSVDGGEKAPNKIPVVT